MDIAFMTSSIIPEFPQMNVEIMAGQSDFVILILTHEESLLPPTLSQC